MRDEKINYSAYYSNVKVQIDYSIRNSIQTYFFFRRIIELLIIFILSPIILFLILLCSIPVFISFKGQIIFRQKRAGYNGKPFTIYKFKTMHDSPEGKEDFFKHSEENVPKTGLFLRKHRLDELPQIWNVIIGDMSFFGPRPEIFELYEYFSKTIDNYQLRKIIPQGITGWAQINKPHTVTLIGNREKLEYDLYYLKNLSLKMDVEILIRTLVIMINGKYSR